jgi:hypothetical protein
MLRACASAALGICLLFVAGCSGEAGVGSERAKTVPFTGKITVDGKPSGAVKVQFLPKGSEGGVRTAYADVKEDGSFAATTYITGDGIVPGKYSVKVGADADASSTDPAAMMSAVAGSSIESIDIDVPAEGLTDIELKLKTTTGGKKASGGMLGQ